MARSPKSEANKLAERAELVWREVPYDSRDNDFDKWDLLLILPSKRELYMGCAMRVHSTKVTKTWTARFEFGESQAVNKLSFETAKLIVTGIAHDALEEIRSCELHVADLGE